MGLEITFLGSVLSPLKHYTKFSQVWIDNFVFRLHCKVTVFILFVACVLVSVGQFFGDPIDCIVASEIPDGVMDTYCWIHSTFTLPKFVDSQVAPGVGPIPVADEDEIVEHKYYQWVCFTLFLQGCCFLIPFTLWKHWEGGKLGIILKNTVSENFDLQHTVHDSRMPRFPQPVSLLERKFEKKLNVAVATMKDFFLQQINKPTKSNYFLKFTICEVLNLFNVLFQIVFLDIFFDGVFTTYGSDVLAMSQQDPEFRNDALNNVFPKVAKCTFNKFGPTGTIQSFDGLCILSLNIINEKIYVLLWFWFVFLSTMSAIQLVWRVFSFTSRSGREFLLKQKTNQIASPEDISNCCGRLSLGDWFILIQLGENIDVHVFAELIHQIAMSFNKVYPSQEEQTMTEL